MPMFDVEYEYLVPEYGVIQVEAENVDDAENVALNKLWETIPEETSNHIHIETIKEANTLNA